MTTNTFTGKIAHIDEETKKGLIHIDNESDPDKPYGIQFNVSDIEVDQRFLNEVIPGMRIAFLMTEDQRDRRPRATQVRPLSSMTFEGVISNIYRLDGFAEVKVETLKTPILFCKQHLENPEDFQRLRENDRVQVEIGFLNFVSRRKPPRANKVIILSSNERETVRLRPALRRSNSNTESRARSVDDLQIDRGDRRRRTASQECQTNRRPLSMPLAEGAYENRFHPSRNPSPTRNFCPVGKCEQLPFLPPSAGWMQAPAYNNYAAPPGPMEYVQRGPPQQAFYEVPVATPPTPALLSERTSSLGGSLRQLNVNGSPFGSNSWSASSSRPSSGLSHPEAFFGFPGEPDLDDSNVVIEMTVTELRELMRQRPR